MGTTLRQYARLQLDLLLGLIALGLLLWPLYLAVPWVANQNGFALPIPRGLPYQIHYAGRSYVTAGMCAGAHWCWREQPRCTTREELSRRGYWPAASVGWVPTVIGLPHAIIRGPMAGGTATALFVAAGPDCYIAYGLEGGP